MITVFKLLFVPMQTWQRISLARPGVFRILLTQVLPRLLVGLAVESYSLMNWGEYRSGLAALIKVSPEDAFRYSAVYLSLLLVSILVTSQVLVWITRSFHVNTTYTQCFTLMAYGYCPVILGRFLDAIPKMNTWVCVALGAMGSFVVLYHGVALALKPDQTKGFGLYLVSILLVLFPGSFFHLLAQFALHGKLLS